MLSLWRNKDKNDSRVLPEYNDSKEMVEQQRADQQPCSQGDSNLEGSAHTQGLQD